MRFSVLGSGSRGNAVFVEASETAILIDCGFSGREISSRLESIGVGMDDLNAIFITHEHHDHTSGAGVVSRRCRIPLFANRQTYENGGKRLHKPHQHREFDTGESIVFRDLIIRSFSLSHDAADPVGFIVSDGDVSLGVCTDTGIISKLLRHRLQGCNGLILEFNHDARMLQSGPYPLPLKQRVQSNKGHLANHDGAALLEALIHPRLQWVVAAHLSEINNVPDLVHQATSSIFNDQSTDARFRVAGQHRPTEVFKLHNR